MDDALRAAERRYTASPTKENKALRNRLRRRAGWTKEYVPCNGCGPSRTVRHHRTVMLCPKCAGNGWTHMEWTPPADASA